MKFSESIEQDLVFHKFNSSWDFKPIDMVLKFHA